MASDSRLVTIITPVAPYHFDRVAQAAASVQAQTVPCEHIILKDVNGIGAGAMRNQGLALVETDFVVFLDADDYVEPTFIEDTLAVWRPQHYVYTDFWRDDTAVEAPQCAWTEGRWHCITALLNMADVLKIGGFDETLTGAEDTEWWHRLTRSGICGIRLARPLFHYGAGGQRGQNFVTGDDYWPTMNLITERYKDYKMACCGEGIDMELPPSGEQFEGAVLAMALWPGNRQEFGRATGRRYPRLSYPRTTWVDRRDIEASPQLWRPVSENTLTPPMPVARPIVQIRKPQANGIQEVATRMFGNVTPAPELAHVERAPVAPDFAGIIDKARRAIG